MRQKTVLEIVFSAAAVLSVTAASLTLRGGAEAPEAKPSESAVYSSGEQGDAPYFVRLTGSGLCIYYAGRTKGAPDRFLTVEDVPLTDEDLLRLEVGVQLTDREEYLMLLEGLGVS